MATAALVGRLVNLVVGGALGLLVALFEHDDRLLTENTQAEYATEKGMAFLIGLLPQEANRAAVRL